MHRRGNCLKMIKDINEGNIDDKKNRGAKIIG